MKIIYKPKNRFIHRILIIFILIIKLYNPRWNPRVLVKKDLSLLNNYLTLKEQNLLLHLFHLKLIQSKD